MRNVQKTVLGIIFALATSLPALADYSEFDVTGILESSLSVTIYNSSDVVFSEDNSKNATVPSIDFGKINTLGQKNLSNFGTGINGNVPNVFATLMSDGKLQVPGTAPTGSLTVSGGLYAIETTGGAIRVQVDSTLPSGANLIATYKTQGPNTPPDLVLTNAAQATSLAPTGQNLFSANMVSIPPDTSGDVIIAGTNGAISPSRIMNGPTNRLAMNIGLLAYNSVGLADGTFTGRVRFTAVP
ncbi:MAG: hypothetical protein EOP47_24585 [Sphingobacteriaceae bacterium]|nr:MAG: hypothetical protein EOP47_24585 [Sphingobacteriaceae bacterium]